MIDFVANAVSAEFDANDVLIIAFGNLVNEELRHSFMIQDMLHYDEQDEALGQYTYCSLLNEQ
jgi:hypothetical protein